jgi:hypothetical protein
LYHLIIFHSLQSFFNHMPFLGFFFMNLPHQTMPCWYKDYYDLTTIEKQQIQEKLSTLPLFYNLKVRQKFAKASFLLPLPGRTEDDYQRQHCQSGADIRECHVSLTYKLTHLPLVSHNLQTHDCLVTSLQIYCALLKTAV